MNKKNLKKPFFASFLEKQVKEPEKVKGGGSVTSALQDSITSALQDNVTRPGGDHVTLKYPSDSDEAVD
ncbi:microviridin/marinostatin family tricyclic proteinase inhibitor [Chryseobacterium daecheongense]|uniref:Serine endopeptidase n=1 Tax=Chryseobacterium daecheongense TaxID=192389 RepID=A0A3N0W5S0_9FLAO|nr:microviridin/marinostatin family tricyclic proteinase inhibitor [Chryseobacterium daecheongense]ROI00335.1 serine endopeptidase [Chryseobacterium daecheongense]TDX94702.1 serine endopeptidase inhibitor I10-like protein [Chryseobacterium daecheongense]UOU96931.1 microviridin/marinostatin family tricyclic proteinase inhibitor [Chryseobacterium daecheongense]